MTNEAKHTPSPWTIGVTRETSLTITGPHSQTTYIATLADKPGWGPMLSNATLIAAAPELLDACKAVLRHFDECAIGPDTPEILRLAIAQATPRGNNCKAGEA